MLHMNEMWPVSSNKFIWPMHLFFLSQPESNIFGLSPAQRRLLQCRWMESSVGDLSWIFHGLPGDTRVVEVFPAFPSAYSVLLESVCLFFLFDEVRPKSAEIFKRPSQPFFRCLVFWPFWIFWVKSMEYLERILPGCGRCTKRWQSKQFEYQACGTI